MRARSAAVLALLAVLGAGAARGAEPASAAPMTDEDVVKMVAAGTPLADVLDAVRARPAAYDLSEDMVAELKRAGVPDEVLAAMRARQAAPEAVPDAGRPRRGATRVAVAFRGTRTLRTPDYAGEDLKERLALPKETAMRAVEDLAVYVACVTAVHVPDLWRAKTPLGRDTAATPRHEMLAFVAGDTPQGASPRVAVPATVEVDLDTAEPHELVAGVAARIGDTWYTLAVSKPVKVDLASGPPALVVRVSKGASPFAFEVRIGS